MSFVNGEGKNSELVVNKTIKYIIKKSKHTFIVSTGGQTEQCVCCVYNCSLFVDSSGESVGGAQHNHQSLPDWIEEFLGSYRCGYACSSIGWTARTVAIYNLISLKTKIFVSTFLFLFFFLNKKEKCVLPFNFISIKLYTQKI